MRNQAERDYFAKAIKDTRKILQGALPEQTPMPDAKRMNHLDIFIIIAILTILILLGFTKHSEGSPEPAIVKIARAEIGKGEIGGNNRGQNVKKYTKGKEVAWCAGFVSWVRYKSGQRTNYYLAAKSYWKSSSFSRVKNPKPGDLILFNRNDTGGHIGIIESVRGKRITSIEGNVGPFPAKVKRVTYQLNNIPNLLGFVRLK